VPHVRQSVRGPKKMGEAQRSPLLCQPSNLVGDTESIRKKPRSARVSRVPHISLVFREMWDTTALSRTILFHPKKLKVNIRGIPHLAKNQRDAPNFLHAALDTTTCAPFLKERRIRRTEPSKLHRKSGMWGTQDLFVQEIPTEPGTPLRQCHSAIARQVGA
jgi:hypothetical protein